MDTTKLFFSNLHYSFDQGDAEEIFSRYKPHSVKLVFDAVGMSKGYGFVEVDSDDAEHIIRSLNHKKFRGRKLYVQVSKSSVSVANTAMAE